MKIHRLRSLQELILHRQKNQEYAAQHVEYLRALTPSDGHSPFAVTAYSYPAGQTVEFLVDFKYSQPGEVNWRERVVCPVTGLNNRMRATVHLFDIEMDVYPDMVVYLTEQVTPTFRYFSQKFRHAIGSEFLGNTVPLGQMNRDGVKNEDLCSLTFPSESVDAIVSLDVLEHVPQYTDAFRECHRCLRPGGKLMWSAPFLPGSQKNVIRARIGEGGVIQHILEPEYHGDPMTPGGVLCFTHFGWEVFEELKVAGFRDAYAVPYQSAEFGYLGPETFLFFAVK